MMRQPQTGTLCSAQTLGANDGTGAVCDEGAISIEGFGIITLTATVNNAVDDAIVHVFTSDAATAPTTSSGCALKNDPNLVDGTEHVLRFKLDDVQTHTIQICAKWLIVYVEASSTSSTTTLTLTLKAHATST